MTENVRHRQIREEKGESYIRIQNFFCWFHCAASEHMYLLSYYLPFEKFIVVSLSFSLSLSLSRNSTIAGSSRALSPFWCLIIVVALLLSQTDYI